MKHIVLCLILSTTLGACDSGPPIAHPVFTARPQIGQWPTADCSLKDVWGGSDGFHQYHVIEVSPGHCQYVENVKAERASAREANRKAQLFNALTQRALTPKELQEAASYGSDLNIKDMAPYSPDEKARELQTAWIIQQTLQANKQK